MDLFGEIPEEQVVEESFVQEPEYLELFTHPRAMDFCQGHDRVEQALLEFYKSGRMPHALIFSGPKGIGKATMAYRLAKFMMKSGATRDPNQDSLFGGEDTGAPENLDVPANDPVFRRIVSGGHSDLLSIERLYDDLKGRLKSSVEVKEVRKVAPFLRMTAADGGWRVVIIDDADTMNRNAQNAILKILEEPPKNTLLILVAHRVGALIPTIRSRARVVHFQPLTDDDMKSLIGRTDIVLDEESLSTLIRLAGGSFGRAMEYEEEGGLETFAMIMEAFDRYPDFNWTGIHKLADDLAGKGKDQNYMSFQELTKWMFAQLAKSKARGQGITAKALDTQAFQEILKNSSLAQLSKICENLHEFYGQSNAANLDKRQTVLGTFSLIAA